MDDFVRKTIENEAILPRLGVEKELGDAVVRQGRKTPGKTPLATWAGTMVQSYEQNPGWKGVNKAF